jgi:hypothetical protein
VVIYTAIFGGYDIFREKEHEARMVCFTDSDLSTQCIWEIECCDREFEDSTREARKKKVLSHMLFPEDEYTLWVDGSLEMSVVVNEDFIKSILGDADIAVFHHNQRKCIYQEGKACKRFKKDSFEIIDSQMDRYHQDGFPPNMGLAATPFVARRNTPQINEFNEMWWDEIQRGSKRDQLSFNYCLWKLGIKVKWITPGNVYSNPYFYCHRYHPKEES